MTIANVYTIVNMDKINGKTISAQFATNLINFLINGYENCHTNLHTICHKITMPSGMREKR